jgi:glycosyltransferase involved in cell wall biosynthesis
MNISFLKDHDDSIFEATFKSISEIHDCQWNSSSADVFITNNHNLIQAGKNFIYYAINSHDDLNLNDRRFIISKLGECHSVFCPSLAVSKNIYETFRLRSIVQYPYVPEVNSSRSKIIYSKNFPDIEAIKNDLPGEIFQEYQNEVDILSAKMYLVASQNILDYGLCYAAAAGVPVVMMNNLDLLEFIEQADVVLGDVPTNRKIQIVRTVLKEHHVMKPKSNKYNNTSKLKDGIKQALERRNGTARNIVTPPTPLPPKNRRTSSKKSGLTQTAVQQFVPPSPFTSSTVYITGGIVGISGYDNFVYEIVKGLYSLGVDVRINNHCSVNFDLLPSMPMHRLHQFKPADSWEITIMPPCQIDRWSPTKRTIIYTMWESDTIDLFWVKQLNMAAMVIVPSQWAIDCFRRCGVTVPMVKIPLGHDPMIFHPNNKLPEVCTFGSAAALGSGGIRKNTGKIIEIFQKAFPTEKDVKLKLKVTPHCPLPSSPDSRVEINRNFLPPHDLAEWCRSLDVFINMSYAEGFGLHLLETMACGRPIISTKYSAVTEYFDESVGWVTNHEIISAKGAAYTGFWANPIESSVIDNLRHVYNNRYLVAEKGERAFIKARQFTWKETGTTLVKLLLDHGIIKI